MLVKSSLSVHIIIDSQRECIESFFESLDNPWLSSEVLEIFRRDLMFTQRDFLRGMASDSIPTCI